MTPEFEQAKREIAEKYFPVSSGFEHSRIYVELQKNIQNGFLSDLTALISEGYVEKSKYDELLRQRDELIERNQMLSKTLTKLNVMVDINTGNKNQ